MEAACTAKSTEKTNKKSGSEESKRRKENKSKEKEASKTQLKESTRTKEKGKEKESSLLKRLVNRQKSPTQEIQITYTNEDNDNDKDNDNEKEGTENETAKAKHCDLSPLRSTCNLLFHWTTLEETQRKTKGENEGEDIDG